MTVRAPKLALVLVVSVAGVACGSTEAPSRPIPPVSAGKVRVRVFAEPAPVRSLHTLGKAVFVATDTDLERWDVDGRSLPLPLASTRLIALAPDVDRQRAWVLSDIGLGHYDGSTDAYTEVPVPASVGVDFAAIARDGAASLVPSTDGGVFVGTSRGLALATDGGEWTQTSVKDPVRAMRLDGDGWLWVATKAGLVARKPSGDVLRVGPTQGCVVTDPRIVVELPGDQTLVIGADDQGHERLAIGKELAWTSYRALPEVKLDAAVRRGSGVVVMGGDRVYRISPVDPSGRVVVRPLVRDGVRLVPLAGSAPSEWSIDPIDLVLPPGATTLGTAADHLLIGTKDLGTARYRDGDSHPLDWLRRKQMFEGATELTVACVALQDCWVATGTGQAWHWIGDRFVASGPDESVLAVVRDPSGPIYALHRGVTETTIHLSRIVGSTWTQISRVMLTTPGTSPEASFAKFSSSGSLWVGLRYHDGGERRQYGLAVIDTSTGKVVYHRRDDADAGADRTMWQVPLVVVDADVRGNTAWFATTEGVARLAKGRLREWSVDDALQSALPRALTIAADGSVVVATEMGAMVWDGKSWDMPPALRFSINDVVATRNGQIWMATERGIAAWDGKKVRRVDTRRGLAENQVLDVEVDQFDRVWARGPGSLTLISQ